MSKDNVTLFRKCPIFDLAPPKSTAKQQAMLAKQYDDLAKQYQVASHKLAVVSEVIRLYPEIFMCVVKALDNSDHWWMAGFNMNLEQWRGRFVNNASRKE